MIPDPGRELAAAESGERALRVALTRLPKAELHLHTEGSMRAETALELASRNGVEPVSPPASYANFPEFAEIYERTRALVGSLDDLKRIVSEIFIDGRALGTVWTELHLVPHLYAGRLGPIEGLVEAALDGLHAASHDGATGALILGVDRNLGEREAVEIARLAIKFKDAGIVAMGLTGNERTAGYSDFVEAFRMVRAEGLGVVPHSGEGGPASAVRSTLDEFDPDRISHGIAAAGDPMLVQALAERGVCLDIAVTSNVMLAAVESVETHPLPQFLEAGVPVTLNADVTFLVGATIVGEYELANRHYGVSLAGLVDIAKTSLGRARSETDLVARYEKECDDWLRSLTDSR
jgi:adenosine deaminase